MYLQGKGVPQDYAKTPSWFQKAADQGYLYAQAELGFIYENGWGVSQDYVQAHMWFNLAAAREDMAVICKLAAKQRDKVAAIMTPDQIAEAQRMAREWMQSHPSTRYDRLMTEQEFQDLFHELCRTQGLNDNKARLAATWTLAARGFVADAVGCLPHVVFVGPPKAARDRAVSLVAAIKGLRVELTRAPERRGIILIEDYDELSKENATIVRDLLLGPDKPMRCPRWRECPGPT